MNNVSIDEVLKQPLSSVEDGSIKNNSSTSISTIDNVDSANLLKTGGMSKDIVPAVTSSVNNSVAPVDTTIEDADGSEAETVVMPGNELDPVAAKKTIRHEGISVNGDGAGESKSADAASVVTNGSSTKPSRPSRQVQEGATSTEKKSDKTNPSRSARNSPSASSLSHDQQQDQPHHSRSRATSESTRSKHDNNDTTKSAATTSSRKRKVSIDGTEDKSAKRRIKREEPDSTNAIDHKKSTATTRSESPSARHRTSTGSANSPSTQKPKIKRPPPLVVGANGRRKRSIDGDSNSSQSPKHSGHPRLTHATDSEMLKKRRDKNGRTRVARACAVNNFEEVREHLKDHPEELNEPDNAGNTPLQIASLEGNTEIVRLLIKKGCKVDTENCDRDSPLIDSVENSHLAVVKLLLEAGVNPRKVNAKGEEPSELVDLDHDDGPAIKEELAKARVKYDSRRRQSLEKGPDTGKDSASAKSPRDSPSINTRSPPPQITRRRAGRSEATRHDLLWITATPENLVNFAGKGDDQAIMHLLNMRPTSDVEAVLAAAKGGHDSCLNLLLAMGKTDPDPAPLEDQKKGYNTPMLAAIGKGTPRIIELLLEQPGFDPTRRLYKNQTYYEIAEKRQGDGWREEFRKLKTAYDEKTALDGKKSSAKSSRTSSPKDVKKSQKERSPSGITVRESSPSASRNGPTRKKLVSESKLERPREKQKDQDRDSKPDRKHLKVPRQESREGSNAISDRELSPIPDKEKRSASDHEAVPRPRKRLVSGRDLKDAQIKQRRSSFVSTVSTSSAPDSIKIKSSPDDSGKTKRMELDEKKERRKARKSTSPQPPDSSKADSNTKRLRISSDNVPSKNSTGNAKVASMSRNHQSSGSAPVALMSSAGDKKDSKAISKDSAGGSKEKGSKHELEEKPTSKHKDKTSKSDATKTDPDKKKSKESKSQEDSSPRPSQPQESEAIAEPVSTSSKIKQEVIESPTKESVPEIKSKPIASRSISPDPSGIAEDDIETAPTESDPIDETDKIAAEPSVVDSAAEDALEEQRQLQEEEELESRKRKREDDEASRIQAAEEQKQRQEQFEQRQKYLETLPRVFSDLLKDPDHARTDTQIQTWFPLVCATGVEVEPDCPESQREDLWVTNFQVAALLVELDLELSSYPDWVRRPLVDPLKNIVWRTMRATIHRWSVNDCTNVWGCLPIENHEALLVCESKFLEMNTFWLRLSDFEEVVPNYPHLQKHRRTVTKLPPVSAYEEIARKIDEAEESAPVNHAWRNLITPRSTQSPTQPTATTSGNPST